MRSTDPPYLGCLLEHLKSLTPVRMNVYFGHGTKKTYPQRRRGAYRADEGSMRDGEAGFEHNHRGPLFELPRAIRPIRKADGKEEEETLTRLARAPRLRLTASGP